MPKFKNSNATFWVIFKQCGCLGDEAISFPPRAIIFSCFRPPARRYIEQTKDFDLKRRQFVSLNKNTSQDNTCGRSEAPYLIIRWTRKIRNFTHFLITKSENRSKNRIWRNCKRTWKFLKFTNFTKFTTFIKFTKFTKIVKFTTFVKFIKFGKIRQIHQFHEIHNIPKINQIPKIH